MLFSYISQNISRTKSLARNFARNFAVRNRILLFCDEITNPGLGGHIDRIPGSWLRARPPYRHREGAEQPRERRLGGGRFRHAQAGGSRAGACGAPDSAAVKAYEAAVAKAAKSKK
jgi:hypothetical protein